MTPCWSRKANALVDKVCKLTLTRSPSLPFDLFRLLSSLPNIWVFHLQVSLLVKMNFFLRKIILMIWSLFLMEISMVIYFYHNLPHNNPPFQEIKAIVKKQKIKWLITKPTTMNDDINEGGGGGRKGRWGGKEAWRSRKKSRTRDKKEKKRGGSYCYSFCSRKIKASFISI